MSPLLTSVHFRRPAAVLPGLAVALLSCSAPKSAAQVVTGGGQFRDRQGRALVLHGMNARVAGIFDVTFTDGRLPVMEVPTLDESDIARMQALGFNVLRLPLSWSGVEPTEGVYSQPYLAAVAHVVDLCARHGIYALIDFHQDAWSKEIGIDGAPLWAILPPPATLLGGPATGDRRFSTDVLAAQDSFFAQNTQRLQEKFAQMVGHVAQGLAGSPAVLGYEILNEPFASDKQLPRLYAKVADAIRAVDPEHLIAFEPSVLHPFDGTQPLPAQPAAFTGAVYAPHIYTAVFDNDPRLANDTYAGALNTALQTSRTEATAWGAPLLVTEFGLGPSAPHALEWVTHFLDDADAVFASWNFWLWKESDSARWGLFDAQPDGGWVERPAFSALLSRPYARAIGGDPTATNWDGGSLTLQYTERAGVRPEHEVFWSGAQASRVLARCDGQPPAQVTVEAGTSLIRVSCGSSAAAHTLTVTQTP